MSYTVQEIDDLREAVIARQKQRLRMRRSELNMLHVESIVRTYMQAGFKAAEILADIGGRGINAALQGQIGSIDVLARKEVYGVAVQD